MTDKLEVPRRKIKKNWYVGLHPDPADRSQPDIHDSSLSQHASGMNFLFHMQLLYVIVMFDTKLLSFASVH